MVFRDRQVLVLEKSNGEWSFPKGHIERGEDAAAAALREVSEEAGVQVRLLESLGHTSYTFQSGKGRVTNHKSIEWFRAAWLSGEPTPEAETFDAALFLPPEEALARLTFAEDRKLLAGALGQE